MTGNCRSMRGGGTLGKHSNGGRQTLLSAWMSVTMFTLCTQGLAFWKRTFFRIRGGMYGVPLVKWSNQEFLLQINNFYSSNAISWFRVSQGSIREDTDDKIYNTVLKNNSKDWIMIPSASTPSRRTLETIMRRWSEWERNPSRESLVSPPRAIWSELPKVSSSGASCSGISSCSYGSEEGKERLKLKVLSIPIIFVHLFVVRAKSGSPLGPFISLHLFSPSKSSSFKLLCQSKMRSSLLYRGWYAVEKW